MTSRLHVQRFARLLVMLPLALAATTMAQAAELRIGVLSVLDEES